MHPGHLIRDARKRHGLSQERLAFRAGTKQSAISRLEKGEISPSVETLELLLNAMGETLDLSAKPVTTSYDKLHLKAMKARSPDERMALAASWNLMAGRLRVAGQSARAERGRKGSDV